MHGRFGALHHMRRSIAPESGSVAALALDLDTPPCMAQTLFPLLVNAKWRRLTTLSEATHSILMVARALAKVFDKPLLTFLRPIRS